MIFRSLRANLNLGLLVSLVVLAIVLWTLGGVAVTSIIRDYIGTRLEHDAETLLVATTITADGQLSIDEKKIQNIYHRPFSGHYFAIKGPEQTLYSRSLWDETLSISHEPEPAIVDLYEQPGPQQQKLLVRSRYYEKQNTRLLIVTAEDMSHVTEQIDLMQQRLGIAILIIIVVLMVIQSLIIRLGMHPVKKAELAVGKLETGELDQLPESVPSEVLSLVQKINRLLHHQQRRLQRSRHAIGDVTHALKTPLAMIMQWYEGLSGDEQKQHETVWRQAQQIKQRIDTELKRARMAGDQRAMARFNLEKDLPDLIDTLQRLYRKPDIQFDLSVNVDPLLSMEREDGMELLGNLLDNAWKWARNRISVTFKKNQARLQIVVEDDGPGIDRQHAEKLMQRGQRQDESITGHGLGLSIVREVVQSYHGTLQLERSEQLGGLRVVVELPLFSEISD